MKLIYILLIIALVNLSAVLAIHYYKAYITDIPNDQWFGKNTKEVLVINWYTVVKSTVYCSLVIPYGITCLL